MRPRLACEVRPEGIVAARAEEDSALLAAISRIDLGGQSVPHLRGGTHTQPGDELVPVLTARERTALVSGIRKALDAVALRGRDVTLVVPDAAARVLLLDFDELPGKLSEALPIVRFRLKKLVPFDSDDAAVSFQVMSSTRGLVRVLAVAMPREVLAEYEGIVREAGFEPSAVLPSTLAALAALSQNEAATLIINVGDHTVTTAITRGGILLLHRSVELGDPDIAPDVASSELAQAVSVATAYFEDTLLAQPERLLSGGTLDAATLGTILTHAGMAPPPIQEIVSPAALGPEANAGATAKIPLGWIAGLQGALAV